MNDVYYIIIACYPDKGMKSYGSKGLIKFENKSLLDHQISWIKKYSKNKIIIIADFDIQKLHKHFDSQIQIIDSEQKNPIGVCCRKFTDKKLCFIDYGCVFDKKVLCNLGCETSEIVCSKATTKNTNLDVGCTINNGYIENMFLDLPNNKFCNIFTISKNDSEVISKCLTNNNLLYFEIINLLIDSGSKVKPVYLDNFLYFNNMRQKNAINKFIKKYSV